MFHTLTDFNMQFQNVAFVNATVNLTTQQPGKVCQSWKAFKYTVQRWVFQIFNFFSWKLKFYHWQQMLSIVFLEVASPIPLICKKVAAKSNQSWLVEDGFQAKVIVSWK